MNHIKRHPVWRPSPTALSSKPLPRWGLALLLGLLFATLACDDDDGSSTAPDPPSGYAPVDQWSIAHDALTQRPTPGRDYPLQTPVGIAFEDHDPTSPEALWVAERTGWRVRRYPIIEADPFTLGSPSVLLAVNAEQEDAAQLPAQATPGDRVDRFGELFVTLPEGGLALSGPFGGLWLFTTGQTRATRLGLAQDGIAPAEGVSIAEADLRRIAGLGFAPATDEGDPPALVLAVDNQVYWTDLSRSSEGWTATGPLRRAVGTGEQGKPETGTLARGAMLGFETTLTLLASDGPHLYMTSPGSGQLLMIPHFRNPDAPLVVIAGGGNSTSFFDPLESTLSSIPGHTLHLVTNGDQRRLFLFERGGAVQLVITVPDGDLIALDWDKEQVRERIRPALSVAALAGFRDAMSIRTLGQTLILGDPDRGTIITYKLFAFDTEDRDNDGIINPLDRDPDDPNRCADRDQDACDDCSQSGRFDPDRDGPDQDGDGLCETSDRDGDLINDAEDRDPLDPSVCADDDGDGCDDCAIAQTAIPFNDGPDLDRDGICDQGDSSDDRDPGRVVAGWELDEPPDAVALEEPIIVHPGALVPYTFRGQELFMVTDVGSGWVWVDRDDGLLQPLVRADRIGRVSLDTSSPPAALRPFQSMAVMPARPQDTSPRLVVSSPFALTILDVEFGEMGVALSSRIAGAGSLVHPVDRAALLSYMPGTAPVLLGDNQGRFALLDREVNTLAQRDRNESGPLSPTATLVAFGGSPLDQALPIDEASGLTITRLDHASDATLTPENALMVTIDDPFRGDIVLGAALPELQGECPMGERNLAQGFAQAIAGGGQAPPVDGALASTLRLTGLTSAVPLCDGRAVLTLAERGRARLAVVDEAGAWNWITPSEPGTPVDGLAAVELASPARLWRGSCLGNGQVVWMGLDGAWWLNSSLEPISTPFGELASGQAQRLTDRRVFGATCRDETLWLLVEGPALMEVNSPTMPAPLPLQEATDVATSLGTNLIVVGRADGGPWQLHRVEGVDEGGAELRLETLSGLRSNPLDGRKANFGRFTDELPLYAGHEDGNLYVLTATELFRLQRGDSELGQQTPIDILWDQFPLGDPEQHPSAFAAEPWDGDAPAVLFALGGSLYRYVVGRGLVARLVGAGNTPAQPGSLALTALPETIHALQVDAEGRIWLRWDGYVGYINDQGQLIAIAGGGQHSPRQAQHPWELELATSSPVHPSLAVGPQGVIRVAEPNAGVVLSFLTRAR